MGKALWGCVVVGFWSIQQELRVLNNRTCNSIRPEVSEQPDLFSEPRRRKRPPRSKSSAFRICSYLRKMEGSETGIQVQVLALEGEMVGRGSWYNRNGNRQSRSNRRSNKHSRNNNINTSTRRRRRRESKGHEQSQKIQHDGTNGETSSTTHTRILFSVTSWQQKHKRITRRDSMAK